ncbi:MAG: hypothetical protein QOG63_1753 [Thermoleophilaceae bacterium]|nr:hypothetical protein [Thermoleophilaceae bacterium]
MRPLTGSPRAALLMRVVPIVPIALMGLLAPGRPHAAAVRAMAASGNVKLANSLGGGAIVSAAGINPGESVSGSVTLRNDGDSRAALTLSKSDLQDAPGTGGTRLSDGLFVRIDDLSASRNVYDGAIAAMDPVTLAPIPAGDSHQFRFTVSMPTIRGNQYQQASMSVRYDWNATAEDSGAGGGPPTVEPPVDHRAPRLRLSGKPRQRVTARGLVVYAVCNEPCTLVARARVSGVRDVRRSAARVHAARTVAAGRRVPLRIVFGRRDRRRLRPGLVRPDAEVVVTVTARDAAGNRTVRAMPIRIGRRTRWIDGGAGG